MWLLKTLYMRLAYVAHILFLSTSTALEPLILDVAKSRTETANEVKGPPVPGGRSRGWERASRWGSYSFHFV